MTHIEYYANDTALNIAAFYPRTTALGPGKRAIIWFQGCLKDCKGCITPEMQPLIDREWVKVDEIANAILAVDDIEGITLLGGEPLLQFKALNVLIRRIRESGMTVMLYTGYSYEELLNTTDRHILDILSNTDILVDGPYILEEDHNEMLRGSANQRILFLTDRYKDWKWVENKKKRTVSVHYSNEGRYLILGIPPKDLFNSISNKTVRSGILKL